jgi:hydroxymethylglutaryl-CoA synthase
VITILLDIGLEEEMTMAHLLSYGSYVPHWRLRRDAITDALGGAAGRGARSVASYDEDTTSMGVEAARVAVGAASRTPGSVYLATTAPAYLDKTNASVIHAALGLDVTAFTADMGGAVRSGVGAFLAAADSSRPALVVLSDVRTGLPGGADERDGGDGAAAFVIGDGPGLAEIVSVASASEEFLDRWRLPGNSASRVWEERFGESVYLPLAHAALTDALKQAGVGQHDIRHAIVTGTHPRAVARFRREAGFEADALADDLLGTIGYTGTAHFGLQLADALDRAEPGDLIAISVLADGASTIVLRVLPALATGRARHSVRAQIDAGDDRLPYATYLTWRGLLDREPPRRPDADAPAAPPTQRNQAWKYRLRASQCEACGTRHLPPSRICQRCGEFDRMTSVPMADIGASVTTYTVDHLAFSPSPPLLAAVLDFDGGGRLRCQLTDTDADAVQVGLRVEMTFRRMATPRGIHNYFWKGRPVSAPVAGD